MAPLASPLTVSGWYLVAKVSRFLLIILVLTLLAATLPDTRTRSAIACSGGIGPLEFETEGLESIVVADAMNVGGENTAPTLTPQEVEDVLAAQYPRGTWTPIPNATATPVRPQIDLTGIGATFSLVRLVFGITPSQMTLTIERDRIERTARIMDAGGIGSPSTCSFLGFVPRYVEGRRYLLFIKHIPNERAYISAEFPVEGDELINGDRLLTQANTGFLYMSPATYARYFDGVPTSMSNVEYVYLADGGVALDTIEKAVLGFLGMEARIAPPDTGSAGLASGRR